MKENSFWKYIVKSKRESYLASSKGDLGYDFNDGRIQVQDRLKESLERKLKLLQYKKLWIWRQSP